jgi:prophage antirepressor-like protein
MAEALVGEPVVSGNTIPLAFESRPIRAVVDEKGAPWFSARDVCTALGIAWSGRTLDSVPNDWQRVMKLITLRRGLQPMRVISEPAVYKLAFRSNKPEADRFTNWVASEVIPALRRDGAYAMPQPLVPAIPEEAPSPRDADMEARLRRLRSLKNEMLETTGEIYRAAKRAMQPVLRRADRPTLLFLADMNDAMDNAMDALDRNLDALEYTSKSYVSASKLFF